MSNYLVLLIFISILVLGIVKKVNIFKAFEEGAKNSLNVILNLFVYLFTFTFAITLFNTCGIIEDLSSIMFNKIDSTLIFQILIRPFSSSSSLSLMVTLYDITGINSFESIFATLIHSGVDAIFYVIGLYQSLLNLEKVKALKHSIVIYLIAIVITTIFTLIMKNLI